MFNGQLLKVTAAKPGGWSGDGATGDAVCVGATGGKQYSRTEMSGGSAEEEHLYFSFHCKQLWEKSGGLLRDSATARRMTLSSLLPWYYLKTHCNRATLFKCFLPVVNYEVLCGEFQTVLHPLFGINLTQHGFRLWLFNGFEQFLWNFFFSCILARLQNKKRNYSSLVMVIEELVSLIMLALIILWVISNFPRGTRGIQKII